MKLSCRLLTLNSYKAFLKNKNRSGKTLSASFSTKLLKKKFLLYSITWPLTIINCLVAFNSWDIGQYTVSQPGKPLESLAISVIPGDLIFFFFRSLFSFCMDFFYHWWLLKVKKNKWGSPSSLNSFYYFFIFWLKGLSLKTQLKIEFWPLVNGGQLVFEYTPG